MGVTEGEPMDAKTLKHMKVLFAIMFTMGLFVNFDSGAVPAVLDLIKRDIAFQPIELGMLGGLQYLGLTLMSPFSGHILQRMNTRNVLGVTMLMNMGFCFMFALSRVKILLLLARLGIGATQATVTIYLPVWIDEFAPEANRTMWMSVLQLAAPLGVMIGYTVSGYMAAAGLPWQTSLLLQSSLLVPYSFGWFFVPLRYLDIRVSNDKTNTARRASVLLLEDTIDEEDNEDEEEEEEEECATPTQLVAAPRPSIVSPPPGAPGFDPEAARRRVEARRPSILEGQPTGTYFVGSEGEVVQSRARIDSLWMYLEGGESAATADVTKQLRILWRCRIFILITFSLSALFFVVTGIQFWVTDYLVTVRNGDKATILAGFALTSATGPAFGVIFGGWFVDKLGGYRGKDGIATTAKCCTTFGFLAVALAIPAGFVTSIPAIIGLIWFVLFFGGAIMAPATGLVLSSVPESLRANSSAFAQLVYNVLGYMMGTFLPGVLMQVLVNGGTSTKVALTWGFRLNLIWSVFGLLFLGIATIYAEKQVREEGGSQSPTPGPELFSPTAGKQNGERATLATGGGGDSAIQMCHNPMDRQAKSRVRRMSVADMDENDGSLYRLHAPKREDVNYERARRSSLFPF